MLCFNCFLIRSSIFQKKVHTLKDSKIQKNGVILARFYLFFQLKIFRMGFSLQQPKMALLQQFVSKPFLSYTYVTLRHVMSQNCHVYHFTWYFVSMICCFVIGRQNKWVYCDFTEKLRHSHMRHTSSHAISRKNDLLLLLFLSL